MKRIELELTDVQYKALACEAMSVEEYLANYSNVRAQKAYDAIVRREIDRRLDEGLPIPSNKDDIVMSEDVKTLAELELSSEADDTN